MFGNYNELPEKKLNNLKTGIMKTLEQKNFEMMMRFALSNEEMLFVRGGGDEGGEGTDESDPEKPPVVIKL
jgi:hypothetical protein